MLSDLADRVRRSRYWQRYLSHSTLGHYVKGAVRSAGLFGAGHDRELYTRHGLRDELLLDIVLYCTRFSGELYYPKCVEYPAAVRFLNPKPGERILDLATMISPLPPYFVRRYGCSVVCTDVFDGWKNEYEQALRGAGEAELLAGGQLQLCREDIRALSFADDSFDKVYSISSIEHLPKDGDRLALRELARVLKPGGRGFVTVEGAPKHRELWFRDDQVFNGVEYEQEFLEAGGDTQAGRLYFGRYYDAETLRERLMSESGLTPLGFGFWGERLHVRRQFDYPNRYANGWDRLRSLQPLIASVNMVRLAASEPLDDYCGLIGFVEYEKPAR